jgi:hypothetical protein
MIAAMPRILVVVLLLAFVPACDSREAPTLPSVQTSAPAAPSVFEPVTNVRQTMEWILDPAVDVIWDSAGFIITAEGETDLSPTTDKEWEHVRNSAAVVAEAGNLLMIPGRSAGPDWVAYSQALIAAGKLAMAAAEAQDAAALFDAGGEVYQACRACHTQFLVPIEKARNSQ